MEEVYYQQGNITVTNTRFIVGSKTYAMRNITSVTPIKINPSRSTPIFLTIVGVIAAMIDIDIEPFNSRVIGIIMVIIGLLWTFSLRPKYAVHLTTSGGEVQALEHRDWPYISAIVAALNQSIMSHA